MKSDFVTIEGNVVYDNASSAVPLGHFDLPAAEHHRQQCVDGFRIIVRDNVSYNNVNEDRSAYRRKRDHPR